MTTERLAARGYLAAVAKLVASDGTREVTVAAFTGYNPLAQARTLQAYLNRIDLANVYSGWHVQVSAEVSGDGTPLLDCRHVHGIAYNFTSDPTP